jgi:hypothetical protein
MPPEAWAEWARAWAARPRPAPAKKAADGWPVNKDALGCLVTLALVLLTLYAVLRGPNPAKMTPEQRYRYDVEMQRQDRIQRGWDQAR